MYSNWISIKILLSIVKLILCWSHSALYNDFRCVKQTVPNCFCFRCQSIERGRDEPSRDRPLLKVFIPEKKRKQWVINCLLILFHRTRGCKYIRIRHVNDQGRLLKTLCLLINSLHLKKCQDWAQDKTLYVYIYKPSTSNDRTKRLRRLNRS